MDVFPVPVKPLPSRPTRNNRINSASPRLALSKGTKGRFWPCFSFALLVAAALGSYGWQCITQWTDSRPFVGLSRNQAQSRAETLCKNLTGAPALALTASGSSVPAVRGQNPHHEWEVTCRAGNDHFFVRMDAAQDRLIVFQREEGQKTGEKTPNAEGEGDLRNLDAHAAAAMGKQYILLSSLVADPEAVTLETFHWKDPTKTVWEGFYLCRRDRETYRARVAVRISDGALCGLQRLGGAP